MTDFENVVSADWLNVALDNNSVKLIDGSWYLPAQKRDARAEYAERHIARATYFDLDAVSDPTSPFPHMLPDAASFASAVAQLGISNEDHVVVYDGLGLFSAPRIWWMFKVFGHSKVSVLNGGLPAWMDAGGAVEHGWTTPEPGHYAATLNANMVAQWEDVLSGLVQSPNQGAQILDARAADRFKGFAPEPRAGLKAGHMPGAINLPFDNVLQSDGHLRSPDALRALLSEYGVDIDQPITTSCGSGVTAAILSLALAEAGAEHTRLYDGSWAEWGQRKETADMIARG